MPVYQKLINFDEMVSQLKNSPIILNNLLDSSLDEKDVIDGFVRVRFTGDTLSALPSCNCGKLSGGYSIGQHCRECYSDVKPIIAGEIDPLIWFKAPEGIIALINPTVWIMLEDRLCVNGFSILQWICDTSYRSNIKKPEIIDELIALDIKRGYNNFVTNFLEIISFLFQLKAFRLKGKKRDYLYDLIIYNMNCVFSQYIPMPNRALLIIQKTNLGVYIDKGILIAMDAIRLMTGVDLDSRKKLTEKENRTVKAISKLASYYEYFHKEKLSTKLGILRKHIFGSRAHFSFRTVVTSITKPHFYDEIHIPWGVGATVFRPHLMNKLLKLGYNYNQAIGFLYAHVTEYHPLLDDLFKELISESEVGRIPCIVQRNPSLLQGSAQLVGISKVKTDPGDLTVGISILIIRAPNGDFDGDSYNFTLAIDNKMRELWYNLSPHKNIMTLDSPRQFSRNISMPKTVIATFANWLSDSQPRIVTEDTINKFLLLEEA
jgi:hypothetical protein